MPITARRVGQRLNGDIPIEPRVGSAVDVTHAATSQQRHDPVRSDERAFSQLGPVVYKMLGSEDQSRSLEKPVDLATRGGEFVGDLKQVWMLGGERLSQLQALAGGCCQPRIVPVREDAPALCIHSRSR